MFMAFLEVIGIYRFFFAVSKCNYSIIEFYRFYAALSSSLCSLSGRFYAVSMFNFLCFHLLLLEFLFLLNVYLLGLGIQALQFVDFVEE